MKNFLARLFRSSQPIPAAHRKNFIHLYMDIFWFGVLNGSTLIFLVIYAARAGASPQQIGFITAAPALVNLLFTLPAGIWVKRFRPHIATRWAWVATRIFYLFFIPLPVFLQPEVQIWFIIAITLLMSVPGTVAAIIGNAFFADVVPPEHRAHVVGTRNAMLAAATTLTSLISGQILAHTPFPTGYQIVFAIGFIGSALSCLHLFLIHPVPQETAAADPSSSPAPLTNGVKDQLRFEILLGPFGIVLLLLVAYNLSVFIGQPVFPLYQVNILKFTDQTISLGTSIFWVVYFLGSIQVGGLARRVGNQKLTAIGIALTSLSTVLFILSFHPAVFVACQLVGGVGWSFLGVGVINYLLEHVPAHDRTPYLSWYNLAINGANLAGAMLGSGMASGVGMLTTLIFVVIARVFAGASILTWGNPDSFRKETSRPVETDT